MALVPPSSRGLLSDGSNAPGFEIGYDQITAGVAITATTLAAPTTVIAGSSHTFDGLPVIATFYACGFSANAGAIVTCWLQEGIGVTTLFELVTISNPAASGIQDPCFAQARFTPTAGAHTYSVVGTRSVANGSIIAGTGGGGSDAPAFLRFQRV